MLKMSDILDEKEKVLHEKSEDVTFPLTDEDRKTINDIIELSDYIKKVALSNNKNDHLHLDDLTLINKDSIIKNIVIEKE